MAPFNYGANPMNENMNERMLISLLADGQFHSGEKLGERLGISRAAVWKQLRKLDDLGVAVESVKGRGYRIPGGLELLDRDAMVAALAPNIARGCVLTVLDDTSSTNDWIKSRTGSWQGLVCLAERQTSGRGRRGRSWVSPFGRNLYLSVGWEFDGGAALLEGLSLAVGVAVCRALGGRREHAGLSLKWPNDILLSGRKLGGILVELQGDPSGLCQVVVGIGVNYGMGETTGETIDQPWADGREITTTGRNHLAVRLVTEVMSMLAEFTRSGFTPFRDEWCDYDATRDLAVRVSTAATAREGVARGVDDQGALILETDKGLETVHGGEVSLRVAR